MIVLTSISDPQVMTLLRNGAVGVLPTDTVYGLVASAASEGAVARLYGLKHREKRPGTVIAASVQQLIELGVPRASIELLAGFWPNPLSIELSLGAALAYIHQGTGRNAYRVVADEAVIALLQQTGPLLTSSANLPGQPPANNLKEAQAYFGDQVDFYVDGGDLSGRKPSTVARYVNGRLEVVRKGAVIIDERGQIV